MSVKELRLRSIGCRELGSYALVRRFWGCGCAKVCAPCRRQRGHGPAGTDGRGIARRVAGLWIGGKKGGAGNDAWHFAGRGGA